MRQFRSVVVAVLLTSVLLVAAATNSDDEIYDKVRIQLTNDRDVKGGAIEVKVTDGLVQLDGNVRDEKQRAKAEKIAKKVKGVKQVTNQLKIAPLN